MLQYLIKAHRPGLLVYRGGDAGTWQAGRSGEHDGGWEIDPAQKSRAAASWNLTAIKHNME